MDSAAESRTSERVEPLERWGGKSGSLLDRIHVGSALDLASQLPRTSVHCVVTSPPYFGHRKYTELGTSRPPVRRELKASWSRR